MKNSVINIALAVFCFAAVHSFGQSTADWETIYVKDLGQIKMPPTLELQAGNHQPGVPTNDNPNGVEYSSDYLVFQQKGLNGKKMGAFNTYVRVIISTEQGEAGTYRSFTQGLAFSPEEIKSIDARLKEQVKAELTAGSRIVQWDGGKETVVNGMNCYAYSFQRQLDDKPVVQVWGYLFYDHDRAHYLTVSYRVAQAEQWEEVLEAMLSTFVIE